MMQLRQQTSSRGAVYFRYTTVSSFASASWRSVQQLFHPRCAAFRPPKGRRPACPFAADRDAAKAKLLTMWQRT